MNTQRLTSTYYDLTHGWHGFLLIYVLIAVFFLAGLKRGRASPRQYFFSPITSLLTLVAIGLSMELLQLIFRKLDVHLVGIFRDLVSVIFIMMGGFFGGIYWAARGQPLQAMHGRGAVVFDGAEAQRHARRFNSNARRGAAAPLTIAGVAITPMMRPSISNSWALPVPASAPPCASFWMERSSAVTAL